MPAVTVPNLLILPRVTEPPVEGGRPVAQVTTAPSGFEGEGFPVRRAFAGVSMRDLDPFVHMDQMGEIEYAAGEPKGTPWHPHRGFETVTYMIDGVFRHQDSNGGGGLITNGDTQWMTAGGGILHIEEPPEDLVASGGLFHGLQLWVNLPARLKMTQPRYQDIRAGQVALLTSADGGALLRVISGLARRPCRARFHAHPDHLGARHRLARSAGPRPVAGRVQRPRLRPRGGRHRRLRPPADPHRAARGVRLRRVHYLRRRREDGRPLADARHPAAGRRAHPGTGRHLRPVRHEHQGRARAGLRGLPEGPPRHHPRPARQHGPSH